MADRHEFQDVEAGEQYVRNLLGLLEIIRTRHRALHDEAEWARQYASGRQLISTAMRVLADIPRYDQLITQLEENLRWAMNRLEGLRVAPDEDNGRAKRRCIGDRR